MALTKDMMVGGSSFGQASAMNGLTQTGISAAGSTIADATQLNYTNSVVSTVVIGQGVKLYNMKINDTCTVYNDTTTTLKVYAPDTSTTINQLATSSGMNLPQNTGCTFVKVTSTRIIANMSA